MRNEYLISDSRPPHCYGGGHQYHARRTYNHPWHVLCELLSPDTCNYVLVMADDRAAALREAKSRWA